MSKDSKNNLEDFFRNSLKDYSENPSKDLWDRIEVGIPPKPTKRFRPAYALVALLLFLVLGFGYEYFQFKSQLGTVNTTVELQKEELQSLKTQLNEVKEELKSNLEAANALQNANNQQVEATSPSTFYDSANKTEKSNPDIQTPVAISADDGKNNAAFNDQKGDIAKSEIATSENLKEEIEVSVESVNALDFLSSKPVLAENTVNSNLSFLNIPKPSGKSFSIEFYSTVSKTFPNSSFKNENQSKVKNGQLSFDIGGLFNLGLNRNWDIQLGVGYNRMVINDGVYAELSYAREELDPQSGTYTSLYSYSIITPSGEMMVNTTLSNQRINDGRDLNEGDPFQLDLQYQNELQYFQLPFFVRYKMGKSKYRFTLKGGFVQKFLLDENIKVNSVNSELDRLKNEVSQFSDSQNSASTTSTDVLFGLGAEYKLSKKNAIHLQSVISYSLKEIYPGLKPVSVGLQLGLQHQIGR